MAPDPERRLAGLRVVITAGGTREPIDPVRFIGNRSSGKMGNALAIAAAGRGARVTLVTAAMPPAADPRIESVPVETASDMLAAVERAIPGANVLVMAAAVADWRPVDVAASKLKKRTGTWTLDLAPTADILLALRDRPDLRDGVLMVGFAAETDDVIANARAKLRGKDLDLIVVNDVSRPGIGMGADDNEVTVIDRAGEVVRIERASKPVVAEQILDVITGHLR